jgi:hypothetical protein
MKRWEIYLSVPTSISKHIFDQYHIAWDIKTERAARKWAADNGYDVLNSGVDHLINDFGPIPNCLDPHLITFPWHSCSGTWGVACVYYNGKWLCNQTDCYGRPSGEPWQFLAVPREDGGEGHDLLTTWDALLSHPYYKTEFSNN